MKQKRTALLKGYVTDEQKAALQSACTAMHKSVSDVLHECTIVIIRDHLDARPKRNDMPPFPGGARPRSGNQRSQLFPARPSYGAVPRMRIRV